MAGARAAQWSVEAVDAHFAGQARVTDVGDLRRVGNPKRRVAVAPAASSRACARETPGPAGNPVPG
jgi:hypothetical protein